MIYTPDEVLERDYKLLCTCESALAVSRQPVAYVAWEPTKAEIELLRENPKRRKVEPGSTIGEDVKVTSVRNSPEDVRHFSWGNSFHGFTSGRETVRGYVRCSCVQMRSTVKKVLHISSVSLIPCHLQTLSSHFPLWL